MSGTEEYKYVWAMEWRQFFPSKEVPGTLYDFYTLEPQAGVSAVDFEQFMSAEVFPAVGELTLRGAAVVKHYLLKQHGVVELSLSDIFDTFVRDESIQARFESLASGAEMQSFQIVGSWEPRDQL